jgi:xanthine dehydrogenase accessory factor
MDAVSSTRLSSPWPLPGGARATLEASLAALQRHDPAVLAVVVDTEGSTYVRAGALALFGGGDGQVGWLSGGCLEPEIERHALLAAQRAQLGWLDIDTRDDEDLLSGSAVGCRGRLHLALLPLQCLPGWETLIARWRCGAAALHLQIDRSGDVLGEVAEDRRRWSLPSSAHAGDSRATRWQLAIAPSPSVLVLGAGPETSLLLPLLRGLGWTTTLVERRPRWKALAILADTAIGHAPAAAMAELHGAGFDAALVMHHNFELDREALAALATQAVAFIGLLGPVRRREDLFRVLPAHVREAVSPRLRSPVGLDLGGHGPEAIALSIAAQLHQYRHPA